MRLEICLGRGAVGEWCMSIVAAQANYLLCRARYDICLQQMIYICLKPVTLLCLPLFRGGLEVIIGVCGLDMVEQPVHGTELSPKSSNTHTLK